MTAIDAVGVAPVAEPFASLSELQHEHIALMRAVRSPSEQAQQKELIHAFLERARATGSRLDDFSERDIAQSILDYWTAALISLPDRADRLPGLLALAEYDPAQGDDLAGRASPFKGLNAFGEYDADWFFGREDAVKLLLDMIAREQLVIVAGPSGSGKSSLVLAGLVPQLKRGALPGSEHWLYLPTLTPGNDPLLSLLQVARPSELDALAWNGEHRPKLQRSPSYFRELVHALGAGANVPVLVVVDQFEELFTLSSDQQGRKSFVEALLSIVQPGSRDRLILTLREDFLERAKQLPGLGDPKILFRPPALTTRELRRVIEEPAKRIGLKIQESIVDDLVKEVVADPTALPLLQFALKQLWEHRERNRITWDTYRKVGRPSEALKRTADEVFNDLKTFENQQTAERIFLALVQPGVGAEFLRRRVRRETLTGLEAADRINRVLDRFVDAGLIIRTAGTEAGDDRFEVAHETLIRNWPRLAEWLRNRKAQSEKVLQLIAAARLWQESGHKAGYLLSGEALTDAAQFRDAAPELKELIAASENAARRRIALGYGISALAFALAVLSVATGVTYVYRQQSKIAQDNLTLAIKSVQVMIYRINSQLNTDTIPVEIAKELLRTSVETEERIFGSVNRGPDTTATRVLLLLDFSDIYLTIAEERQSLALAEKAASLAEQQLRKDDPENARWQHLIYLSAWRIGDGVEASDPGRAMQEYSRALQIAEQLAEGSSDLQRRRDIAFIRPKIGDMHRVRREWTKALEHYNAALVIYQDVAAQQPDNLDFRRDVATTQMRIGDILAAQGKLDEARPKYELAISIEKKLVKDAPEKDTYQSNLSRAYNQLAELYKRSAKWDEALAQYNEALQLRKLLVEKNPSNATWQGALARQYVSIGDVLVAKRDARGAADNYREAIKIQEEIAFRYPGSDTRMASFASTHEKLGIALAMERQFADALKQFQAALSIREKLAAKFPDHSARQRELAAVHARIGDALKDQNEAQKALEEYRKGLAIIQGFLERYPNDRAADRVRQEIEAKIRALPPVAQ